MRTPNNPTTAFETSLLNKGIDLIAGIDEVGRGSWAGPLVAASVIFPVKTFSALKSDNYLRQIRDSKLLSYKKREMLAEVIKKEALSYHISEISAELINSNGLAKACQTAFMNCVISLNPKPMHILIDAFKIIGIPLENQTAIIKGDLKCFSIAAASIIAKDYRDKLMEKMHSQYPHYQFNKNKGYGTSLHIKILKERGFCPQHRTSYKFKFLTSSSALTNRV